MTMAYIYRKSLFFILMLVAAWLPSSIYASDQEPVQIDILTESSTISADATFWTLVHFKLDPGWHLYWENPGDAGAPPQISWTLPEGFEAQAPIFTTPHAFSIENTTYFGYDNEMSLLIPIKSAPHLASNSCVTLDAEISYVACKTLCVPGKWKGSISLSTADQPIINPAVSQQFIKARAEIPHVIADVSYELHEKSIEIIVPLQDSFSSIETVQFYPHKKSLAPLQEKIESKIENSGHTAVISLPIDSSSISQNVLSGILVITGQEGKHLSLVVDTTFTQPEAVQKNVPPVSNIIPSQEFIEKEVEGIKKLMNTDMATILLFAFVGGLILNLMPCVLPVISIKLVHYIQMRGQNYWTQLKHGLSFSLGILLSFWILAAIIFGLQTTGKVVGWGFQLQEPIFVSFLIIIIFVLSLSLFGVFDFGLKMASLAAELEENNRISSQASAAPSIWASFLSGVLTTFVASPCTGPLLGSALGFTATQDPAFSFLIFSSLGLGMAFPYLMLSLFPGFAYLIPKPGRWMVTFKHLMGFFMLATALWLIWVLEAEVQKLSLATLFFSFFCISFGLWVYGTFGGIERKRHIRSLARTVALAIILAGSFLLINDVYQTKYQLPVVQESRWEPWSADKLQGDQIVFVNFTAKWCLTCQVNKTVLESSSVQQAFEHYHVRTLVADWTNGDPEITKMIHSLGRNGVPVYAIYGKNKKSAPQILPELLTPDIVIKAIEQADK